MELNEYVKNIGKDILNIVIKAIEENKGDDDKYYECAYLKLQDGTQIIVRFKNYLRKLNMSRLVWNNEYERNEGYYFSINTHTRYGFCVDVSLRYLDKENLDYVASDKDYGNKELNEEEIEAVVKFIDELHNKFLTVKYDKENTRRIENYNYEEECKYNKQRFNEAMNKLREKNSDCEVLPSVETAVDWWIDAIKSNSRIEPYGTEFYDFIKTDLLNDVRRKTKVDDNQIEIFRESLTSALMKELSEGESIYLRVTNELMSFALEASNIASIRVPYRASMDVSVDSVVVHENYESTEIYNSNEKKLTR